ncbi:GntR family transcriptional regulator [Bacillus ectoiniformans]|uniref:GntR family transcriptional regulator n=1 Tax=Bacillus ectoiniformans TaxID=1494429 RepID=UPI00195E4327|nr:GntR family transcriptional regulator [Bacillus ectoiniformans]MBM7649845.1 GntR family transcriptional regulator [Bacillus ectoiniformans]
MFSLDMRSRQPLYEQLIEKFKEMIMYEVYEPDDQLPSVRQLAKELAINPNTIQKAYRELEREGFIYSLPGKGSFVKKQIKSVNEQKVEQMKAELLKLISEAMFLGLSKKEIEQLADQAEKEMKGEDRND